MYNIASEIKNHRLYSAFEEVKERLKAHQFVCWIAGGAVRDFCLGRKVDEFDLVTDATTATLKVLFPEALLVGESFGVLKLPAGGGGFFDLATFRCESDYLDGRRPSQVSAGTPVQDSQRRDFTVNALFWDDEAQKIIDYQNGLMDLRQKRLICVGNPETRFTEDYLRIMRLLRFSAALGFSIDNETQRAAHKNLAGLSKVSGERLWSELKKIMAWKFIMQNPLAVDLMRRLLEIPNLHAENVRSEMSDALMVVQQLAPERDLAPLLKKKLKISNQEEQSYQRMRFLLQKSKDLSLSELAFELDKSPALQAEVQKLMVCGLFEKAQAEAVQKILAEHPQALISAQDISQRIPPHLTGEEFRNLRLMQFSGRVSTKAEVQMYLDKKYAGKSEKT